MAVTENDVSTNAAAIAALINAADAIQVGDLPTKASPASDDFVHVSENTTKDDYKSPKDTFSGMNLIPAADEDNIVTFSSTGNSKDSGIPVGDIKAPPSSAKSANYPILDDDGFDTIEMTAGSSTDKTATLPLLANNIGRVLTLVKADTGTKNAILGAGASTINGYSSINLVSQNDYVKVKAFSAGWVIIGGRVTYSTGWVSNSDWTDRHLGTTAGGSVVHNMGVPFSEIDKEVNLSSDGTEANAMKTIDITSSAVADYGTQFMGQDNDNLVCQTGVAGVFYLLANGNAALLGASTAFYYNVTLRRKF